MGNYQPKITDEHISQIRKMIADNPGWNRTRISKELCDLWDWRSPLGQRKDISARDLLRALDRKGLIKLPPALWTPRAAGGKGADKVKHLEHDRIPVNAKLSEILPLHISIVLSKNDTALFKSYIQQYHYLGYERSVGENIRYFVYNGGGSIVACIGFGASAWSCRDRDEYIGWDTGQRRAGLQYIANNSRFLIPPWIRVPHLASRVLGAVARRISGDWENKYGHRLLCLETFVERDRFRGVCYKAANWRWVGVTTGLGRNSRTGKPSLPTKDVYLLPLARRWREMLIGAQRAVAKDGGMG